MALDQRFYHGTVLGWNSCTFLIGSARIFGLTAISLAQSRDRQNMTGMDPSGKPLGQSRGALKTEPTKIRVYAETAKQIRNALAAASPTGTSYGESQVTCDFFGAELSSGQAASATLNLCTYIGETSGWDDTQQALVEEITLLSEFIERDGKVLYNDVAVV
jgi:hypothetical protein